MNDNIDSLRIEVTAESQEAINGLNRLIATLEKLQKFNGTKGVNNLTKTLEKISNATKAIDDNASVKLSALADSLNAVGNAKISPSIANNLNKIADALERVNGVDNTKLRSITASLSSNATQATSGLSGTVDMPSRTVSGTVEELPAAEKVEAATEKITKGAARARRATDGLFGSISAHIKQLGTMFKRRVLYRAMNAVISGTVKYIKEGINAVYLYSRSIDGDLAKSLDRLSSTAKYLKGSLGAAFSPLIVTLTPVIEKVVDKLVDVLNIVNQVIARLSGASTWTKAVKTMSAYAGATDKANKAASRLKNTLLGIDEINAMQDNSADAGLSATSGMEGFKFETLDINTPYVDKIIGKLEGLWTIVKGIGIGLAAWKIASGVTGFISTIGKLFGKGGGGGGGLFKMAMTIAGVPALLTVIGGIMQIPGLSSLMSGGIDTVIQAFKGIATVGLEIIGVSLYVVAMSKVNVKGVLKGLADMALVIGGTTVILDAVGALQSVPYFAAFLTTGISSMIEMGEGIEKVALPIVGLSAYIVSMGMLDTKTVLKGLGDLALVIGGTTVILDAVGALQSIPYFAEFLTSGIAAMVEMAEGIEKVATPIAGLSAYIILMGFATPATILSGMEGLGVVIGGMEVILTALGALKQIPGFTWIVGEGGEVLCQLGNILGEFAGSIIDGFIDTATEGLPDLGTRLSDFMTNLKPFLDGAANVTEGTMQTVENLAKSILIITAADLLESIASFLGASTNIDKFIGYMPTLGEGIATFAEETKDISESKMNAASAGVAVIASLVSVVPKEGGIMKLLGEQKVDKFFDYLPTMGEKLRDFSLNIDGFKGTAVDNAASGADTIISLTERVPTNEGLIPWIRGTTDLKKFAEGLPIFGTALREYSENIDGMKTDVVDNTTAAVSSIIELANALPESGGWWQDITGEKSLSSFGWEVAQFSVYFRDYYNNITKWDTKKVQAFSNVLSNIVSMVNTIKSKSLLGVIEDFADDLADSTEDFNTFFSGIFNWNSGKSMGYEYGSAIGRGILEGIKSLNAPLYTTSTSKVGAQYYYSLVPKFASGGFVDEGEMFIAREAGAELVGSIGNRTAVVNNDQIVESVALGVAGANAEQNQLLREQNSILRQLLAKDSNSYITTDSIISALDRKNRRDGKTIVPVGV